MAAGSQPGADIADPLLKRLFEHWEIIRDGRPMPSQNDLDPIEMRSILDQTALLDVLRTPLRYRVRMQGRALERWAGSNLTGLMLDALPFPEMRSAAQRYLGAVIDSGWPNYQHEDRILDNIRLHFEVLVLPLSTGAPSLSVLLAAIRCHE